MDSSDAQLRQLRLAVHDALAGLDELILLLKIAQRTPEAQEAEALTRQTLALTLSDGGQKNNKT